MYDTSASSFSLGGLDCGTTIRPKRFKWVKMNLDIGAAVNTFPTELWSRRSRRWKILSDCQCRMDPRRWRLAIPRI